jgi:hypothetical protein
MSWAPTGRMHGWAQAMFVCLAEAGCGRMSFKIPLWCLLHLGRVSLHFSISISLAGPVAVPSQLQYTRTDMPWGCSHYLSLCASWIWPPSVHSGYRKGEILAPGGCWDRWDWPWHLVGVARAYLPQSAQPSLQQGLVQLWVHFPCLNYLSDQLSSM